MEKFVELIQKIFQERFYFVGRNLVSQKIPTAFLSVFQPFEDSVKCVKKLRNDGVNVKFLITPPHVFEGQGIDEVEIVCLNEISKINQFINYIIVSTEYDARVAIKNFPNAKVILFGALRNIDNSNNVIESAKNYSFHVSNFFMNNLDKLKEVYESLIDEESKKTFYGYWLGRITYQFQYFHFANGAHYITTGFIPDPGSIFIDGGVFEGSTAMMFSELGCKVYGFEMDSKNFETAKKVAEENNFTVENFGLGQYKSEMKYISAPDGGGGSQIDVNGSEIAQIITLDSYVREKNLPRVDCIKLDVEGAELDVLKGASTTIKRFKPILLLSAYHKLDDFWVLMNYIKSIRPDYEWALRHYVGTPEDYKGFYAARDKLEFMNSLGLDISSKNWAECCLLAR